MRILITGGAGYIGSHTVVQLVAAGHEAFVRGGVPELVTTWPLYALLGAAVVGTIVQQYAFAAGNLATSLPASKIVEPLLAFSLGLTLLGESFRDQSVFGYVLVGSSVSVMLISAAFLTRVSIK